MTALQRMVRAAYVVAIDSLVSYPCGRAARLMRVSWTAAVMCNATQVRRTMRTTHSSTL